MKWNKLKDMFNYVDEVNGAKAMLDFVEANLTTELGEEFFEDFANIVTSAAGTAPIEEVPAGGN